MKRKKPLAERERRRKEKELRKTVDIPSDWTYGASVTIDSRSDKATRDRQISDFVDRMVEERRRSKS